jgi:hypothetical protein
MVLAALDPDAVAVSPDAAAGDRDGIDSAATDTHADKAVRYRVSALENDTGKIDSGSGCGGDDYTALACVRDTIPPRANSDLALHLGTRAGGSNAGSFEQSQRRESQHHGQKFEHHGRTG